MREFKVVGKQIQIITIERNTFNAFDYSVLYALSVDGIHFNHNKIARSQHFKPFHARKNCLTFEACLNVEVKGNVFESEVLAKEMNWEKWMPVKLRPLSDNQNRPMIA
jgi:DNA-directed RNA polymerase beta subunit